MQPKAYQTRVLERLSLFLAKLKDKRDKREKLLASADADVQSMARKMDFVEEPFNDEGQGVYHPKVDGLGKPLPDVYIKVPTGGGKTFLACHAIERVMREYLHRQAGVVLWIVPTSQIYAQTLKNLRDRSHPYRQILEIASGGRVVVLERKQRFSPANCRNNLVVLLLMLQAGSRESRETLRIYKNNGGFGAFFPDVGNPAAHAKLLEKVPNLETMEDGGAQTLVKHSLGNVLRLQRPLVIMDEGQRAASELARKTLCDFNPAFVLELSATPPQNGNVVAAATGKDLDKEEMIKLDINLSHQETADWKTALLKAQRKREELELAAEKLRQKGGQYIRPIAIAQVERTGAKQRGGNFIHAEDAREFLIANGVLPHCIAVKSSDTDEIKDADLLSESCPIRYVITKQALQEGWDCSFAYVLAALANLGARVAMTQLIGRVLRQPYAQKTSVRALNESYVFTHRENARAVVSQVRAGLNSAGLGDLTARVAEEGEGLPYLDREYFVAEKYKKFKGRLYLPQFVVCKGKSRRRLDYVADILAHLDWENLRLEKRELDKIVLSETGEAGATARIGIGDDFYGKQDDEGGIPPVDSVLMTRLLCDGVFLNPWRAHRQTSRILDYFEKRDGKGKTARNFVFIIEETKRLFAAKRDKMAEALFRLRVNKGEIVLLLARGEGVYSIPAKIVVREKKRKAGSATPWRGENSLFDGMGKEGLNELEGDVALCLDGQERLLWWYRNNVGNAGYALQGWKKGKVYPDFIAAKKEPKNGMGEVLAIETKGAHLQNNEDTGYKRDLFLLCNDLSKAEKKKWEDLGKGFPGNVFLFQVVDEADWKNAINGLFETA